MRPKLAFVHILRLTNSSRIGAALGALICGGILIATAYLIVDARNDALAAADRETSNVASSLKRDITRNVGLFDLSLKGVLAALQDPVASRLTGAARQLALFDNSVRASYFSTMLVMDEHGRIVEDSTSIVPRQGTFSDREFFQRHRLHDGDSLIVSRPFVSRLTSERVIALSRRINKEDGSFGGIVVGTIRTSYFQDLFMALSLGSKGAIAVIYSDGSVVEQRPAFLDAGGAKEAADIHRRLAVSDRSVAQALATDNVARRYVVRSVDDLPLHVIVGLSTDDILEPWRRKAIVTACGTLILICGLLILAVISFREIARRQRSERRALASEARYRLTASNSSDGIVVRNADGYRLYASPAYYRIIGRTPEELGERRLTEFLDRDGREAVQNTFDRLKSGEQNVLESFRCPRPNGSSVWVEAISSAIYDHDGFLKEVVTNVRDATDRKLAEEKLEEAASIDRVTGISNRRIFDERFSIEWRRASYDQTPLSLLMIDVDHFKDFNDRHGHLLGDVALKEIATVMVAQLHRARDFAARFGGEEYVVVLPETSREDALAIAEKLRRSVEGVTIAGAQGSGPVLTVSVGVATIWPQVDYREAILVEMADVALYDAKARGRNQCVMASGRLSSLSKNAA